MFTVDAFDPPAPRSWIVNTVASRHVAERGLNEVNPGTGFERALGTDSTLSVGHYLNSINVQSVYAGVQWTPVAGPRLAGGDVRWGAITGLVTGYRFVAPVVPMAGVIGTWDDGSHGVNLMFVPNPLRPAESFFGVQMKRRLP